MTTSRSIENNPAGDLWAWASQIARVIFPFVLFLVSFLPLVLDVVARSPLWDLRSGRFIEAIVDQRWADTFRASHPGVTTMWLAGIARLLGEEFDPEFGQRSLHSRMGVELIPITLVIALSIVLAYFVLAKIFDRQIAATATVLVAIDPFHLLISKTLHVDALMSIFVVLSTCFLWLYLSPAGRGRNRFIFLSGLFAGLALLSKVPSLFMLPYMLLCLAVSYLNDRLWHREKKILEGDWRRSLITSGGGAVVWTLAAILVFVLLWPAMWVEPIQSLQGVVRRTTELGINPHPKPLLFFGELTDVDPGLAFYPIQIFIKTTMVTLPFFLISPIFLFNRQMDRSRRMILFLALAFVFFFTVQMTLGEKKFARYILPVFQVIIIIAAVSLVYVVRWLTRGNRWLLNLSLIGIVLIQAAVSIPRHPYYGTHFNTLAGGPRTVLEKEIVPGQEQGEGLDIAARYLNSLPESNRVRVASMIYHSLGRHFVGETVPLDLETGKEADYIVFARNTIMRGIDREQWRTLWDSYRVREPDLVVSFDDVPYVWVYKTVPLIDPAIIKNPVFANINQEVRLMGYNLQPGEVRPGEQITLTLFWEAMQKPAGDYKVFTHLIDPEGIRRGQKDARPQNNQQPTYSWQQGEQIEDSYVIDVSPEAPTGDYQIAVGMYIPDTGERLSLTDENSKPLPEFQFLIPGPEVRSNP